MRIGVERVADERSEMIAQMLEAAAVLAREQGWTSFALMGELGGHKRPHIQVQGRWQADPVRLIGELAIIKERLTQIAVEERDTSYGGM